MIQLELFNLKYCDAINGCGEDYQIYPVIPEYPSVCDEISRRREQEALDWIGGILDGK